LFGVLKTHITAIQKKDVMESFTIVSHFSFWCCKDL